VRDDHRDGTCDLLIEPGVTTEYAAFEQDGPVGFFHIRDGDVVAELLPKLTSRYKPIPTIVHPSQDRAHSRAVRGGIAFTLLVTVPLFFLGFVGPPAVLFFATVVGLIAYAFVRGRSSTCPGCGAHLVRDPDTPRGTYYFTCTKCRVRWASRIITT
jgi:hypothetical protein